MEDGGGLRVLDPHDVSIRDLFMANMDFLADMNCHRLWIRYKYDEKRPPPTPHK